MKEALIIADVAGEMDALLRLVANVPLDCPVIGVGDLCDRGPDSSSVIEWFIKTERADAVKGNHEDMMVDYVTRGRKYEPGVWEVNGGWATLESYQDYPNGVPDRHIDWLASRPMSMMIPRVGNSPGCLVTHAPLHRKLSLNEALFLDTGMALDYSLLWNRTEPIKREWFQIFGHNSHWGLREFQDEQGAWALCIDQSRKRILTGFHWPSGKIFEEPYTQKPRDLEVSP